MPRTKTDRRKKPAKRNSQPVQPKASQTAPETTTQVLDTNKLKALYAAMLKSRMLEEKLRHLAQQGKVPGDSLAPAGHEAVIVGTAMHLQREDFIAPSRSLFLAASVQGAPTEEIFKQLSGSRALPDMPLATQLTAGSSAALALKLRAHHNVALSIVEGDKSAPNFWHEAVSFASRHLLPIVFVICTDPSEPELRDQAHELGLPGITVDGNDVVAVFRVAQESIRRARGGHGPCVIECKVAHTHDGHSYPDHDPVAFMEGYLQRRKLWSDGWKRKLIAQNEKELQRAQERAAKSIAQQQELKH
jgi:TPP-dependent pyruvate/acetoin dehydrogenase alpha subunit